MFGFFLPRSLFVYQQTYKDLSSFKKFDEDNRKLMVCLNFTEK